MDEAVEAGRGGAAEVWREYGDVLRREPGIRADLASVGIAVPRSWEVRRCEGGGAGEGEGVGEGEERRLLPLL